ncbi:Crinkler (CRN), partial [Phytophthora megakarya]
LTCVFVRDRRVFHADIDERKKVSYLNDMTKEKKIFAFPADQLTLYVAQNADKWLTDVTMLENGEVPSGIKDVTKKNTMNPAHRIDNTTFKFTDEDDAGEGEIHVLVELPEAGFLVRPRQRRKTRPIEKFVGYWKVNIAALPKPTALKVMLQQPLPFRLALDDDKIAEICDQNGNVRQESEDAD